MAEQTTVKATDYLLEDLLSEKEAAKKIGVGVGTLRGLRERGCPYVKLGMHVFHHQQTLVKWITEHCSMVSGVDSGHSDAEKVRS